MADGRIMVLAHIHVLVQVQVVLCVLFGLELLVNSHQPMSILCKEIAMCWANFLLNNA
jgi:hypothetical protein